MTKFGDDPYRLVKRTFLLFLFLAGAEKYFSKFDREQNKDAAD